MQACVIVQGRWPVHRPFPWFHAVSIYASPRAIGSGVVPPAGHCRAMHVSVVLPCHVRCRPHVLAPAARPCRQPIEARVWARPCGHACMHARATPLADACTSQAPATASARAGLVNGRVTPTRPAIRGGEKIDHQIFSNVNEIQCYTPTPTRPACKHRTLDVLSAFAPLCCKYIVGGGSLCYIVGRHNT